LFGCAPGHWQLQRCTACHTSYVDPRPTPQSIARAYQTYFTHTADALPAQPGSTPPARRWGYWAKACVNGYRNARWGMALAPSSAWGRHLIGLVWPMRSLTIALMRHLPPRPPRPGARLLDVGCGNGDFLDRARAAGWQVQGVDFDAQAVASARAKGLDVRVGGLDQLLGQVEAFDCVTCSHVIEHVHDPARWLKDMHTLLRADGRLWLQTPNINSIGHAHFGPDWLALDPPRHLVLFTPASLTALMEQCGFQVRLLPLPMAMAVSVYEDSRSLKAGHARMNPLSWRSFLHAGALFDAVRQSLQTPRAEFITVEAVRR
jgi:2-polyprenyl-3-methyl-5-hydroxy-6-metoxy-1,4-benzoquinol methylase